MSGSSTISTVKARKVRTDPAGVRSPWGLERCPYCSTFLARDAIAPEVCPSEDEPVCPLVLEAAMRQRGGSMEETAPWPTDFSEEPETDDFPREDDLVDTRLGQYWVKDLLGQGSMGRVYRAEHEGLGRPCALKIVNPGLVAKQPKALERFWAEARAAAGLIHPNIVTVHNIGSDRGYHFIEMEYVPGGVSLRRALIRNGPLDPSTATSLVYEVVLALGAAHRAGMVHRDVKPANVLLTEEGRAKLADFGLVSRLNETDPRGPVVAGTPTFMAPELFAGVAAHPRSDFYALGIMYYYLLSARIPFSSSRLSRLIHLHKHEPIPDIRRVVPEVSEEIVDLLDYLLAKAPADRPRDAREVEQRLQAIMFALRDPVGLLREAIQGIEGVVEGGPDRFQIFLETGEGRIQEVRVEIDLGSDGIRRLIVSSVCGDADPDRYELALRLNAELTRGGLSIREVDGTRRFVMTRVYAAELVDPAELRAAILEIADRGVWLSRRLAGIESA